MGKLGNSLLGVAIVSWFLFNNGCQSYIHSKASVDLLRPWHKDANLFEPFKYPFIATYKKADKNLIFAAVDHVVGKGNSTTKTIEYIFEYYLPEIVVIEGFENDLGISPEYFVKAAENCSKANFQECGESYYSMYLAIKHKIAFVGGEPDESQIVEALKTKGYTIKDFLGLMLLMVAPQWQREGKVKKNGWEFEARQMLRGYSDRLQIISSFSLEEFYDWYKQKSGAKVFKKGLILEDTSPHAGNYASYFQKLSYYISLERDKFLVEQVSKLFKQYNRILVVYGGSHHFVQQKVYENMLGTPKFFKPF